MKELLDDVIVKQTFGEVLAYYWSIEFQKRGLPHMHLLVTLFKGINDAKSIDTFVSAEIPDEITEPNLHAMVRNHMMHGPCGILKPNNVCMDPETKICRKQFPKTFEEKTTIEHKVPRYKRPNNGRIISVANSTSTAIAKELDNRWVVPYNWQLLLKYTCHINTEVCTGNGMTKYITKYIFKGHDQAIIRLGNATNDKGEKIKLWIGMKLIHILQQDMCQLLKQCGEF